MQEKEEAFGNVSCENVSNQSWIDGADIHYLLVKHMARTHTAECKGTVT